MGMKKETKRVIILMCFLAGVFASAGSKSYLYSANFLVDNNLKNKAFESCPLSLEPDSFPIYHNKPQKKTSNFYLIDFFHRLNRNYIADVIYSYYDIYFNNFESYYTKKKLELVYDKKGNLVYFTKKIHLDRSKYGFCFYNPFNELFAVGYDNSDYMLTYYNIFDTKGRLVYSCQDAICSDLFLIPRIMYFFENF